MSNYIYVESEFKLAIQVNNHIIDTSHSIQSLSLPNIGFGFYFMTVPSLLIEATFIYMTVLVIPNESFAN